MVTTGIVSLDDSGNYFIPQALKPGLKELNQAFFFPVMATLTEKVKICFRNDGPKGYTYGEMPAEVVDLLEKKIPDCDIALEQILDPVMELRKGPICTILDLGCGGGNLSRALSRRFTDAVIYAVDYNTTAIKRATENPNYPNVNNIQFLCLDAKALPSEWTNMFDWVILYDVLHDLSGHVKAMDEVRRVLKEDGIVSLNDPDLHSNVRDNIGDTDVAGVGYAISTVICLPSSMSDGEQSGHGMGWGTENKEEFLTNAGWVVTDKRKVGSHLALNFTCVKKE
ncbi:S-adenosylmethionine-dependent methyltransferase Rv2258c-like [Argopecten irradians]|uniref:S-adenosylmethionine-dependent methyltransferase Rv2258c-like n=1 Tax=Argopecten irradians TaxID=31199 RepID=UPI003719DCE4